jgi:hypothetical protein
MAALATTWRQATRMAGRRAASCSAPKPDAAVNQLGSPRISPIASAYRNGIARVRQRPIRARRSKSAQARGIILRLFAYMRVKLLPGQCTTNLQGAEPMMTRLLMTAVTAALLGCGQACAQVGGIGSTFPLGTGPTPPVGTAPNSPLGMISPPSSQVGRVGIPLGATELATPGESPATAGASPMIPLGPSTTSPLGIPSPSPVGRVGIPLGASELSPGGLSPP